jgi:NADPH-dependent ferric siderophore reductase
MYSERKNDATIMEAIKAANNGHHTQAAQLFQRAGNQYRNPSEKKELWAAAERSRRIANSD